MTGVSISFAYAAPAPHSFIEGVHYQRIGSAQSLKRTDKIEVVEMFWYGCQTCYLLLEDIERWVSRNQNKIDYKRIPAITEEEMIFFARAFYAAEVLSVTEKIHKPFFKAIHQYRRRLNTEDSLAAFFFEHGVAKKDFIKAFRSSFVASKVRQSKLISKRFKIKGAPSVIIGGQYLLDSSMVRSPQQFIDVMAHLVRKVENNR